MDVFSPEKRSAVMAAIPQTGTKPELKVRKAATLLGLRYRIAPRTLPGRPDLAFPGAKTALFVHGCFWHRHGGCRFATTPRSNIDFWQEKFARNVSRDAAKESALEARGWRLIVIWECETTKPETVLERLAPLVEHYRRDRD
ncbi:hypothetical protein ASD21_00575 [Caulobacter sp. Root1455]|uniref:very short patch repair endonuclease n=1 Tax=Caulobacter sp. Root1455 TaxID=1736465 RepID=UPI0006FCEFF3|nr:DNA mismatch endonuclease Vsr [Caulobacter sp. Root1455]KQZ06172.1 hypothetical protein ASD21_00575 [Caulobacter sp. Root1455]